MKQEVNGSCFDCGRVASGMIDGKFYCKFCYCERGLITEFTYLKLNPFVVVWDSFERYILRKKEPLLDVKIKEYKQLLKQIDKEKKKVKK